MNARLLIPVLTFALVAAVMTFQAQTPEAVLAEAPLVHLPSLTGFAVESVEPSAAELEVLPADTRIEKLRYAAPNGEWFVVSLVVGGRSKSSIHRPELCLPAQGYQMASPRTCRTEGRDWRVLTLSSALAPALAFAYRFFNQEGFRTASHTLRILKDVWDRSLFNRIDRWTMVTVAASRADEPALLRFLSLLSEDMP